MPDRGHTELTSASRPSPVFSTRFPSASPIVALPLRKLYKYLYILLFFKYSLKRDNVLILFSIINKYFNFKYDKFNFELVSCDK